MTDTAHPGAAPAASPRALVLAAAVLHDVDVDPTDDGPLLPGGVLVPWSHVRRAASLASGEQTAPAAVARRLREHAWVAAAGERLPEMLRPVGVPADAEDHPGLDWVTSRVLGDALDLGPGFLGLDPARPDDVVVVPAAVLRVRGVDLAAPAWQEAWQDALDLLERMGGLAADRMARDPGAGLRPYGDCDVVTLLASRTLRTALGGGAGGLRTVAVPLRTRGWTDLRRIDPAYAVAAAAAAPDGTAGFSRPLLVTAEEVVQVRPGGRPAEIDLRDASPATTGWRTDGGTLL